MADWQERVQAMIMGFVFAYMVMKLFAVIANFRAGNMRVERASDADTLLASTSEAEVETETETEAEPGRENSASSSSSSSDEEGEEEGAAAKPVVESKDAAVEEEAKLPEEPTVAPASTSKVESEEETVGGAFEEEEEEEAEDEEWEDVESTELEKRFGAASTFADDTMMVNNPELQALYKLATEGPCSSSQPSAFQPTARAKWNAWQKLGSMSQEEAMQKYIHLVTAINPNWYQDDRKGKEATQQQQADVSPSSGGRAPASCA